MIAGDNIEPKQEEWPPSSPVADAEHRKSILGEIAACMPYHMRSTRITKKEGI